MAVSDADEVVIVETHGHGDHTGAARALADAVDAEVFGPPMPGLVGTALRDGDSISTDQGDLVAVLTPGHTEDHLCFHWPARGALFAGDLLLGDGDTTWVAEYPGCVADYLDSLERLRTLDLSVIYPAHGPPLEDPTEALDRFEAHRRSRIEQVEDALVERPDATLDDLLQIVYGDLLPSEMRGAASRSLSALLDYARRDRPA
jgi:glyoxylase-like metal-dependent hydrolase (beta-lactamase superfamily II)